MDHLADQPDMKQSTDNKNKEAGNVTTRNAPKKG